MPISSLPPKSIPDDASDQCQGTILSAGGRADVPARPLPAYEPDDGPLTDAQIEQIRTMVPQGSFRLTRSLFPDFENKISPPDAD